MAWCFELFAFPHALDGVMRCTRGCLRFDEVHDAASYLWWSYFACEKCEGQWCGYSNACVYVWSVYCVLCSYLAPDTDIEKLPAVVCFANIPISGLLVKAVCEIAKFILCRLSAQAIDRTTWQFNMIFFSCIYSAQKVMNLISFPIPPRFIHAFGERLISGYGLNIKSLTFLTN